MKMILKKVQSPLIKKFVYDLGSYNKDEAVPYFGCIYKISKTSGEYNRDITEKESQ